ncbi:cupin domain-containing protein [candidate division CSSED10-310 bacterium]|uniref:Cupin domain-containing protein n=1 Tax=candidate division CSSED10-310 bacterium TaxID=2855610 RepID=A0ABV6YU55_UNCC1
MKILQNRTAPRYQRDNITSYLLVSSLTCDSKKLTITLVDMAPGGIQKIHAHEPEQMYFLLEGEGIMTVNGEEEKIGAGDCVFFDSFAEHGLENTGTTRLRYLSAASPSFSKDDCLKLWPLASQQQEGEYSLNPAD